MVEHSTADREVGSSIPLAPFFIIMGYLSLRLYDDMCGYLWVTFERLMYFIILNYEGT